jgi:hypothetical protein
MHSSAISLLYEAEAKADSGEGTGQWECGVLIALAIS